MTRSEARRYGRSWAVGGGAVALAIAALGAVGCARSDVTVAVVHTDGATQANVTVSVG